MKRYHLFLFFLIFIISNISGQVRVYTPELILPVNGAEEQMPKMLLDWNAISSTGGLLVYEVEWDIDNGFIYPENIITDLTAFEVSELYFDTIYFWRVRAIENNDTSDWSEIWTFHTVKNIELDAPSNGSTRDPYLKFAWDPIEGVNFYDIVYDTANIYWNEQKIDPGGATLRDLFYINDTLGWIIGDNGTILKKSGNQWIRAQEELTNKNLYSFHFVDDTFGIAVGNEGTILYYFNGIWMKETQQVTENNLRGIYCLSCNNAWAVGKNGTILHYNGLEWVHDSIPWPIHSNDIYMINENNGFIVGAGHILHWNGIEWTLFQQIDFEQYKLFFLNDSVGWTCGKKGTVYKYNGTNWVLEHTCTALNSHFYDIMFIDEDHGSAVGNNSRLYFYKQGEWIHMEMPVKYTDFFACWLFTDDSIHIVGEDGKFIYNDTTTFSIPDTIVISGEHDYQYIDLFHFGTRFYWKMRGQHNRDTTVWSDTWYFKIINTLDLNYPPNGEQLEHLSVELLRWEGISHTINYEVQVDEDSLFISPLKYFEEYNSIMNVPLNKLGQKYYWHVRANHYTDTSDWSEVWNFSTPNTVKLRLPENGASDVALRPNLSWKHIETVDYYEVWYDSDPSMLNCGKQLIDGLVNAYMIHPDLENEQTYYWQVRAIFNADTSDWSEIWSFTTLSPQGVSIMPQDAILIYPNPAKDHILIKLKTTTPVKTKIRVMDITGKEFLKQYALFDQRSDVQYIDIKELGEGIYIIHISSEYFTISRKISIIR